VLYFFLSYARGDDDVYVERFYRDLCAEVRVLTGAGRDEEVGFLDNHSIEPGQRWPLELVDALAKCHSFLALCSPAYFLSEPCGREWTIFQERSRLFEQSTGTPAGALIPLLWLPTRTMPAVVQTIQYTRDILGDSYNRGGVRQLLRLRRHRDTYREFVSAVAELVVDAAGDTVPPLATTLDFDQFPSAFHAGPALRPAGEGSEARVDGVPVVSGSHFVHFVVVAPTRAEAAAIRTDVRSYGDRPQDWAPYRPALDLPLCEYACRVAADRSFQSTVATIEDLDECIRLADQHNQIVVLLVDAWSARLDRHRQLLRAYDQRNELTTAVMIPWSHDDAETQSHSSELAELVRKTFLNNSLRRDDLTFRSSVLTHDAFGADLQVVLEVVRNRVFVRGTVYRRPALEAWNTRARLVGP
jgi:FxsC-like protein